MMGSKEIAAMVSKRMTNTHWPAFRVTAALLGQRCLALEGEPVIAVMILPLSYARSVRITLKTTADRVMLIIPKTRDTEAA